MIRRCSIDAKGKINLGLEILGKRADGFHDICSILAMIDLADTLKFTFRPGTRGRVSITPSRFDIDPDNNLVTAAISAFNVVADTDCYPEVTLSKQIPVASGLGGASSDCAATLLAMNHLMGNPLPHEQLFDVAARLGSDVPFFLGSPVAYVTGRGTEVHPLPAITDSSVVVLTPNISIAAKTPTLYRALRPEEFSDGSSVRHQIERLRSGRSIDSALLGNTFESALARISAESVAFRKWLHQFGDMSSWLSGAGPSRYLLPGSTEERAVVTQILASPGIDTCSRFTVEFAQSGLEVHE